MNRSLASRSLPLSLSRSLPLSLSPSLALSLSRSLALSLSRSLALSLPPPSLFCFSDAPSSCEGVANAMGNISNR